MEHNNTSNNQGRDDSSFSLLPQCNECTFANGVGGVCGTNKLWLFFKEAHERYQTEVIGCGKLYHRYKKDFLNSHSYTDCQYAAGKNEHKKNFYIMEEFLEEREDLVVMFFTKWISSIMTTRLFITSSTPRSRLQTVSISMVNHRQYYKQHKKPNRNRTFNVTLILLS